jgi:4-hydroxy-3-polyprenylbenzoate decarboxylase
MAYPWKSFREWIADEEKIGDVLRVKAPIKCGDPNSIVDAVPANVREENLRVNNCLGANGKTMETELRALVRYLHTFPNSPIGLIEKPINIMPSVPIAVNPWATRERCLRMFGLKNKEELCKKYRELKTAIIPPKVLDRKEAPVKEVVIHRDELDLYKHTPRCWVEFENVPWSPTGGGMCVLFDPETKTHDLGEWREGYFEWEDGDPNKPYAEEKRKKDMYVTLIYGGPVETDGGRYYRERFRKKNKPMPAAMVMCNDPALLGTAIVRLGLEWPEDGVDELSVAGGFKGEPIEVVEAETIPGLMLPAHSEWVIEGEFLPEDYIVPKYGEAILSGYMFGGEACPIFRIKCITRRKDPMWCVTWSTNGFDHEGCHTALVNLFCEAEAINYLRQSGYHIKNVVSYDLETIVVQTDVDGAEKIPHYGKAVLSTLYGCANRYLGSCNKYYIAVGPDIDPYNLRDVLWAMNTRSQPVSDSIVIKNGLAAWGDPSAGRGPLGWKAYGEQMLIDALIKVPERMSEYEPRSDPASWEKEAIQRMKDKIEK